MATDTYWQLEREYYTISPEHDLEICVIEYGWVNRTHVNEDGTTHEVAELVATKVHEFRVKREILAANSAHFKATLYDENGQPVGDKITIYDDEPSSIEVWAKILHGADVHSTLTTVDLKGVWEVLATANRYQIDPCMAGAKAWFEAWYDANKMKRGVGKYFDFKDYQSLLFPCYSFDYAEGFQQATKYLAYRAQGHITERKPDGFKADVLRLDQIIIQQLNAAKGRLKTILHRNLYHPIERLLRAAKCECKAEALYAYELALHKTGAWPLESAFLANTVHDILNMLNRFDAKHLPQMCRECDLDYKDTVTHAVAETRNYFDGLCLDCMDASKPKLSSEDEDYWKHTKLDVPWDAGCRISHDQPTWYFSFMGRKAKMMEWRKEKQQSGGRSHYRGGFQGRGTGAGTNAATTAPTTEDVANGVAGVDLNE